MTKPAISIHELSKAFGRQQVLDRVSLQIEAGERMALVGANGAGKSTLIRLMLDFLKPEHGRIELFGVSSLEPASRACLAFLPERFTPPAWITAQAYLRAFVAMHGVPWNEADMEESCALLHLDGAHLRKPIRQLSKGMTQKVGLLATFLSNRPLLILDEPMSGLDPLARIGVKQLLQRAQARGATLFYSSHLLADVESHCDRLAILHRSRFLFVGSVQECLERTDSKNLEEAYLRIIGAAPGALPPSHQDNVI